MKGLNFWQWLGIALLVIGGILLLRRPTSPDADRTPAGTPSSVTTPATQP